jgi:putative transposase
VVEQPRHLCTAEQALKRTERRVARRRPGSHRREQAVALRARKQQQVSRQRLDGHHQAALLLVQHDDTSYLDDVQVRSLVRNRHLATSIGDAGWAQFRASLASTAACDGKRVVAVPAQYTSQECSGCGERVPKRVRVRTHVCPSCGLVLDRGANAALKMFRAGQARQGAVALAAVLN